MIRHRVTVCEILENRRALRQDEPVALHQAGNLLQRVWKRIQELLFPTEYDLTAGQRQARQVNEKATRAARLRHHVHEKFAAVRGGRRRGRKRGVHRVRVRARRSGRDRRSKQVKGTMLFFVVYKKSIDVPHRPRLVVVVLDRRGHPTNTVNGMIVHSAAFLLKGRIPRADEPRASARRC